jgi:hypothetical protein
LLANDLLVLELKQFAFFFKVSYDLTQRLFEQLNFGFKKLDFLCFFKLPLGVLFYGKPFVLKLFVEQIIFSFNFLGFLLQVFKFFILESFFIFQTLVLSLNVALNFRNIFLSLLLCILLGFFIVLS